MGNGAIFAPFSIVAGRTGSPTAGYAELSSVQKGITMFIRLPQILFALVAFVPAAFAMNASDVASCPPAMERKMETLSGLFKIHVVCDQVFFEIPKAVLGKDLLVTTEFAAVSVSTAEAAPGEVVFNGLLRFVRRGNRVFLERVQYDIWAFMAPNIQRGVEAAQLGTVIKTFEVKYEGDDGAPVIEMTALFVTEVPDGFGQEYRSQFRVSTVDPKRSYIARVKAFPHNASVRFYQTWVPDASERQRNPDEARDLGFMFHTNILLLPEQPMKPRYYDERVGYFPVRFLDYGTGEHGGVRRGFIQRYRIEKKDPTAAVSDTKQPVVFYISRDVPSRFVPYLKEAVTSWNVVFEAAGFRNALSVRDAPGEEEDPTWDPEDLRYNVIRWTPSGRQNASGPAVVDPRSGEVIASHTIFWHDILKLLENWYVTQAGALDPRAKSVPLPDDLMGELLRYVATHEVGHALGLRHNFKAHSAYTVAQLRDPEWTNRWGTSASIMSYSRFNYVAQPGDNAGLFPKFGPYDYFAIQWGYSPIGAEMCTDEEWVTLDQWAARQIDDPSLRFGGEDVAAEYDPNVNTQVLSSDPIAATALGLKNIDRVARQLVPATDRLGRDYSRLGELYEALVKKRDNELGAVAKLVGGVEEIRFQGGRGSAPFMPVPPERQKAAVKFLTDNAFSTPDALLDRELVLRITPTRMQDPLQGSNIQLFSMLLRTGVFQRMAEARTYWPDRPGYEGIDLLKDLNNGLFRELDSGSPKIDFYRREVQRNYVARLKIVNGEFSDPNESTSFNIEKDEVDRGSVKRNRKAGAWSIAQFNSSLAETAHNYARIAGAPSEFRASLREGVNHLGRKIQRKLKSVKDPATLAHLNDLISELEKMN